MSSAPVLLLSQSKALLVVPVQVSCMLCLTPCTGVGLPHPAISLAMSALKICRGLGKGSGVPCGHLLEC